MLYFLTQNLNPLQFREINSEPSVCAVSWGTYDHKVVCSHTTKHTCCQHLFRDGSLSFSEIGSDKSGNRALEPVSLITPQRPRADVAEKPLLTWIARRYIYPTASQLQPQPWALHHQIFMQPYGRILVIEIYCHGHPTGENKETVTYCFG